MGYMVFLGKINGILSREIVEFFNIGINRMQEVNVESPTIHTHTRIGPL